MKATDLGKLSTRMFKARTSRTLLTILGMGVGIGAILFLVSLGYGLQKVLLETITTSDSLLSLDVSGNNSKGLVLSKMEIINIEKIDGVLQVSPAWETRAQVKFNELTSDSKAIIVEPSFLKLDGTKIAVGKGLDDNESNGVIISSAFAKIFNQASEEIVGKELKMTLLKSEKNEKEEEEKESQIEIKEKLKIIGVIEEEDVIVYVNKKIIENKPQYEPFRNILLPWFEQLSAEYIIPLVHNEFIGIIVLSERANLKALSNDEIEFLQNIKSASSIAIANSLMYHSLTNLKNNLEALVMQRTDQLQKKNEQMEFELKLAKTVQKTLLPSVLPANNQLFAAVYFRPYMEVSGDFFLLEQLDDTHYLIGIVDISGHGIPSALLTSMIKTEIENLSRLYSSTSAICTQLNRKLTPILQESGFYFTLFLGIIDFVNMELLYTNCGHTDIYVITLNDTVYPLTTDSLFIGADENINYPECLFELNTKDRIILYSDGITETRAKSGHLYGNERFTNILVASREFAPQDQIDIIIKDLENFIQSEEGIIRDDVTLCVIEIGEPVAVENYLKKAITLYKKKNYNEALSILNSISTVPLTASYNYLKAKLLMKNKHYEEAKKAILLALKEKPDHKEFNYLFGQICFAMKDYQTALDTFADLSMMQPYKKSTEFMEIIKKKM